MIGDPICPARRVASVLVLLPALSLRSRCTRLTSAAARDCGSRPTARPPSCRVRTAPRLTYREGAYRRASGQPSSPPWHLTTFDATYRLTSKGNRPNAKVRMRTKKTDFVLMSSRTRLDRGALHQWSRRRFLSDRRASRRHDTSRTCFLVAKHLNAASCALRSASAATVSQTTDRDRATSR